VTTKQTHERHNTTWAAVVAARQSYRGRLFAN